MLRRRKVGAVLVPFGADPHRGWAQCGYREIDTDGSDTRAADMDASIGERIRERRKLLGTSIRLAADRAGIHHSTWSRIEAGQMGADNRYTLAAIAAALRCSMAELTGGAV